MTDKVELIKAKVEEKINLYERLLNAGKGGGAGLMSKIVALQGVLIDINFIQMDSLPEEPVSRCLEEASKEYATNLIGYDEENNQAITELNDIEYYAFKAGAKWQKNHVWHSPDEKPKEDKDILFLRSEAFIHNSMCYTDCNFCNDAMRGCDKWCYIADLED